MKLMFWKKLFFVSVSLALCLADDVDVSSDVPEAKNSTAKKVVFQEPALPKNAHLALFLTASDSGWIRSATKKDGVDEVLAKYDGLWSFEIPSSTAVEGDHALVFKSKAKHGGISIPFAKPFLFTESQLVVQYEVRFQEGHECGGAYVKLLSHSDSLNLKDLNDKTPYTIMFGPDRCGMDSHLHFIIRYKNPVSGVYEEKKGPKPKGDLESYFTNKKTHLYTLVLNNDNSFEIYVDQSLVSSGNLLKDMDPPINPEKTIDDPSDTKPTDWDDREKIVDEKAKKPDDWDETLPEYIKDDKAEKPKDWLEDEPLTISDPKAVKPKDWDSEMDGEWEAPKVDNPKCKDISGCGKWTPPQIKNPAYKGPWSAPLIDNPAYKGVWKARKIENPHFYEDSNPYKGLNPISALSIEIWSMNDEIAFDNFIVVNNKKDADLFASQTWVIKAEAERKADPKAKSVVDAISETTSEKPWIWAIVAAAILLPCFLIYFFCFRSSAKSDDSAAARKKTDEAESDDEEPSQPATALENEVNASEGSVPASPKAEKQTCLNGDVDEKGISASSASSVDEAKELISDDERQDEVLCEPLEDSTNEANDDAIKSANTRQRKPRKD